MPPWGGGVGENFPIVEGPTTYQEQLKVETPVNAPFSAAFAILLWPFVCDCFFGNCGPLCMIAEVGK